MCHIIPIYMKHEIHSIHVHSSTVLRMYYFSTTENAHANLARRLSLTYKFSEKSTIGASGKERKYPAGSRNRLGGRKEECP